MARDPFTTWRRTSLALYALAFFLPVVKMPDGLLLGAPVFALGFLMLLPLMWLTPLVAVLWLANPAYWTSHVASLEGRWRLAASSGVASAIAASILLPSFLGGPSSPLCFSGYFVWLTSMWLQAGISLRAWWTRPEAPLRLQFHTNWVMAVVAALTFFWISYLCSSLSLGQLPKGIFRTGW